jgi:thiamine transport system permease protein
VAATCLLLVTPVLALVWRAFGGGLGGLSLRAFTTLGDARRGSVLSVAPLSSIGHSLVTASAAALFAVAIGVPAALAIARARRSSWLTVLVALPLGVSAVTVGFGYVVAFDDAPLDLRGSAWVVPLAQAVIALPFVVRIVTPVLVSIESGITEAAADLGAPPVRVLTAVTLPIARPAIAAAGAFAFIVALGEFGAAAFLATPDRPTLPVAISRLLGQPGSASLSQAAAMSVILMVVTAVGALAIDRFGRGTTGAKVAAGRTI